MEKEANLESDEETSHPVEDGKLGTSNAAAVENENTPNTSLKPIGDYPRITEVQDPYDVGRLNASTPRVITITIPASELQWVVAGKYTVRNNSQLVTCLRQEADKLQGSGASAGVVAAYHDVIAMYNDSLLAHKETDSLKAPGKLSKVAKLLVPIAKHDEMAKQWELSDQQCAELHRKAIKVYVEEAKLNAGGQIETLMKLIISRNKDKSLLQEINYNMESCFEEMEESFHDLDGRREVKETLLNKAHCKLIMVYISILDCLRKEREALAEDSSMAIEELKKHAERLRECLSIYKRNLVVNLTSYDLEDLRDKLVEAILLGDEGQEKLLKKALISLVGCFNDDLDYDFPSNGDATWAYEQALSQETLNHPQAVAAYHRCEAAYFQASEAWKRGDEELARRYEQAAIYLGGCEKIDKNGDFKSVQGSYSWVLRPGAACAYHLSEKMSDGKNEEAKNSSLKCAHAYEELAAAVIRGDDIAAHRFKNMAKSLGWEEEDYDEWDDYEGYGDQYNKVIPGATWAHDKAFNYEKDGKQQKSEPYRTCAQIFEQQAEAWMHGDEEKAKVLQHSINAILKSFDETGIRIESD